MAQLVEEVVKLAGGARFRGDVATFLAEGKADPRALAALEAVLRTAPDQPELQQVARALVAVGSNVDKLFTPGRDLVRDPEIVAALAAALDRPHLARDFLYGSLARAVPVPLLQPHGAAIARLLSERPDRDGLLLLAKVKPPEGREMLARLATDPTWGPREETRIARAALGDAALEKEFVGSFLAAQNPEEKVRLAALVGRIGTPAALAALGAELRTPLIFERPLVFRRSVRLDVLQALSYNFPDQPVLWEENLRADEDYARAEQFVSARLGTKWEAPRPPFLTVQWLVPPQIPARP